MRGSESTEKPTDSRRSKGRRETRELQQTADRNQIQTLFVAGTESLQQITHRPPEQAAGEPTEQVTRSQV